MKRFALTLAALAFPAALWAESYPDARSIVSIGGPVTEIVVALGQQDRLVARDTTSQYPPEIEALPDVGYMRQLSAEGVLSVAPDLIITRNTAGPVEVLDQLRAAAVPIVEVEDGFTPEAVVNAIRVVGAALGTHDAAEALATKTEADFAALASERAKGAAPAKVLFILSNQNGRLNVAGRGTGADGIIGLAGAENVMGAEFEGYRILNDEALAAAAPDVVLMMDRQEDHSADADTILSLPALAQSPAAARHGFVKINPAALGFGPRTAEFARVLHLAFADAMQAEN